MNFRHVSKKTISLTDGIFFGPYEEGRPGIQPERLPPFDMTINPLTYGDFNGGFPNNEVHNSGEIWAAELKDWLTSLGIPSRFILLSAGFQVEDEIKILVGGRQELIK